MIDFLTGLGGADVEVQYRETGWWIGSYDKEQKLYDHNVETLVNP